MTSAATTDAQRLAFTLVAAALVLVATAIAVASAHYEQTRSPLPPIVPAQVARKT